MGEAVDISRCEDKAATQLKGIGPKFVLMVAGRAGAIATLEIVAPKHVKQIGRTQVGDDISLAVFVDQQGKLDARFSAENAGIVAIAKADGGKGSPFVPEGLFVFAQLRDVLTAKDSAIVAKDQNSPRFTQACAGSLERFQASVRRHCPKDQWSAEKPDFLSRWEARQ